jgi:arylsulfatase A-like enzyme
MSRFARAAVALALAIGCAEHSAAQRADAPNVLFILVDDLGWRDVGVEGSSFYKTPRIDAFARRNTRFERAYSASRVCSPSRASIMTGQYPTRHGITTWIGDPSGEAWRKQNRHDSHFPAEYERRLSSDSVTLAEVFRDAGYCTFFAGKWHLGGPGSWPEDHGFEINIGGWGAGSPRGGYFAPWENPSLPSGPDGESLTLRLAEETAAFIEGSGDRPFFAVLSLYAVHGPIQTTREHWSTFRDAADGIAADGERFAFDRRANVRVVQDCPIYAGMIRTLDDAVGRVLDQLAESGKLQNTIVCITSDNGGASSGDSYPTSNLPLRGGKGTQWEGGIRVPAYIAAPGFAPTVVGGATPMHGIDWMPTLLELADIDHPEPGELDGVSLVAGMRGGTIVRDLFFHFPHYGNQGGEPSSVILHGTHKLIAYHEDGRRELYDVALDPGERLDLAGEQPERTRELHRRLRAWLDETNARMPEPDPEFDPVQRAERLENIRSEQRRVLERRHAAYVAPDFDPGNDWWGSKPEAEGDSTRVQR